MLNFLQDSVGIDAGTIGLIAVIIVIIVAAVIVIQIIENNIDKKKINQ